MYIDVGAGEDISVPATQRTYLLPICKTIYKGLREELSEAVHPDVEGLSHDRTGANVRSAQGQ